MSCVTITREDLEYCEGEHQIAGFYTDAYLVDESDIQTFPKMADDPTLTTEEQAAVTTLGLTAAEKKVTLIGNITLKSGKKFTRLPILNDSGQLEYNRIKPNSPAVKTDYSCNIQYTSKNEGILAGWTKAIVLLRPLEGNPKLLGRPGNSVQIDEEKGKNGSSSDGEKMISLKFSAKPFRAADYKGTIQLTPAT